MIVGLIFAVTFISYSLLLTKDYYWDGIFFAQTIEDAKRLNASLVHPSHLLDMLLHWLIYRTALLVGFAPRALTLMQISNCVFGAAAACVFFRICRDSFKSLYVSLVLTAFFAFSATWWKFATDADSYILAVLLLLVCFYLAMPNRKPRPFLLAIVHILAMCVHELSALFFPVALAGLIFQGKESGRTERIRCAAKYALIVVPITIAVYFATFYLATGSLSLARFAAWITYFSPEHGFTFGVWKNLSHTLRSPWRVFFGGRISFVRDLWGPVILTLVIITFALNVAFFVTLLRRFSELKTVLVTAIRARSEFKPMTMLCGIWAVVYIVFLFFFIPHNTFYRLFYLPALILLAGTLLAPIEAAAKHVRRYRAALFAVALFVSNLTFSQYPYSQVRSNPPLEMALRLHNTWPSGTTVYFAAPNSDNLLIRYFNPAGAWISITPDEILNERAEIPMPNHAAWIETTLIDQFEQTREGRTWLEAHTIADPEFELVNRKHRIRFRKLRAETLWLRDLNH